MDSDSISAPRRVVGFALQCFYRLFFGLTKRSSEPYASHQPILAAMACIFEPGTVTEFGAGRFSTAGFLDRRVFKQLLKLRSFENNRQWCDEVERDVDGDERFLLTLVNGPMANAVNADALSADLIFVDDSDDRGRADTLGAIARILPDGIPVVMHDPELWRIRLATRAFEHWFYFDALNPQTGVAWNGNLPQAASFAKWNQRIRQLSNKIPVADRVAWRRVLEAQGPEI